MSNVSASDLDLPAKAVKELPAAIELLTRREAVILKAARSADFNMEKLEKATADSTDIH